MSSPMEQQDYLTQLKTALPQAEVEAVEGAAEKKRTVRTTKRVEMRFAIIVSGS